MIFAFSVSKFVLCVMKVEKKKTHRTDTSFAFPPFYKTRATSNVHDHQSQHQKNV